MQKTRVRAPKGSIQVEPDRGWLRLRWTYRKTRYALALGLPDSDVNRRIAQTTADVIKADILANHFDATLKRYQPFNDTPKVSTVTVVELFSQYTDWKRRQISRRSLDKYLGFMGHLQAYFKKCIATAMTEDQALNFRDWLIATMANSTARERISMIRSCWNWGISRKLVTVNPWDNVKVKKSPRQRPQPFTKDEYRKIIAGFESSSPDYVDFVRFLMGVGCRFGEAVGLRWGHLSPDCKRIWISESWGRGERKGTKTGTERGFELSSDLASMLRERRPPAAGTDDLIFTASAGNPIDDHNFRNRHWKPILADVGVAYRKPYNCRHTFISQALDQGWSVSDVASITGNSEETILRHYTGGVRGIATLRSVWS